MDIYEQMKAAGVQIDHHESDLYVPVNDISREILKTYEFRSNVTCFTCNIDKKRWYDIPFAYTPWWEKRVGSYIKMEEK